MANTDLSSLFFFKRLPSGVPLLLCLLYMPLGVCLLVVRFFIAVQAFLALSLFHTDGPLRRLVVRVMAAVLGVVVRTDQDHPPDARPRLMLANHVSWLDTLAVQMATPCDAAGSAATWPCVRHALRQRLVSSQQEVRECGALLLQPEGTNTSGRAGLLTFSAQLLDDQEEVQPVAIRVRRLPLADVRVSTVTSSPLSDLLYFLFVPVTLFTVSFLSPVTRLEGETTAEFVERARVAIALQLKITPTKYSAGDKAELVKRLTFRPPPPRRPAPPAASPELQRMALQVKEVLPRVPLPAIVGDLKRTRSVDQTIANLLEGVVRYVPEELPAASASAAAPAPGRAPLGPGGTDFHTGAAQFARSSADRQLSFEERKRRLLDNARRRYIERNSLQVPGYNC